MDYSKSLDIILDKYIHEETYGDILPVLKHIFHKRASEFEFSDQEMENQIKEFCKNCTKITLEFSKKANKAGSFKWSEERITLNTHPRKYLHLYPTLIHEVYHAISPKGVLHFNGNTLLGTALDEICTEKAAMRTTPKKITSRNYLKTSGYHTITPILNLLASSIGLSEKQLLKASFQGREKFMQIIYSKFPGEIHNENVEKMFQKFETSLDVIYNTSFGHNQIEPIDPKTEKQILSSAFQGLEETAFELAAYQMSSDEKLTPAEKAYRLKNMESIIKYLKKENTITSPSTVITHSQKVRIFLMDGVKEALANPDHTYEQQRFYEEHRTKTNWKDIKSLYKVCSMASQNFILSILPEKSRNKIKLFINRNAPKLLDSGKDNNDTKNKNLFREEIRVKPEDLIPIETKPENNEEIIYTQPQDTEKHDSEEER